VVSLDRRHVVNRATKARNDGSKDVWEEGDDDEADECGVNSVHGDITNIALVASGEGEYILKPLRPMDREDIVCLRC